jgi:Flp pilus assembly protein TadG
MTGLRTRHEGGSMSVEVVLLMPILVMFTLLVVAGGRYVSVRGDIEAAARDAARAASFERTYEAANASASAVAQSALGGFSDCTVQDLGGDFRAGGRVDVTLTCTVSGRGLGLIGLGRPWSVEGSGSAPLDTYRRTG